LDFENEDSNIRSAGPINYPGRQPSNHFANTEASTTRSAPVMRNWQSLYKGLDDIKIEDEEDLPEQEDVTIPSAATGDLLSNLNHIDSDEKEPFQLHNNYIVVQIRNGFIIINQHLAHIRILYERYLKKLNKREELIQKQLFPISVQIAKDKIDLFNDLMTPLKSLGFEIQSFGGDSFVVHGIPAGFDDNNLQEVMDKLVDQYLQNLNLDISKNENLARSMAQSAAIKAGKSLSCEEMKVLIMDLFACEMPYTNPSGKKCFITFELNELEKQFS
jgi:DNA mismatch repair protein MutL